MTSSRSSQTPTADSRSAVTHWVPEDQPDRVSDVAQRLLDAYRAEGGRVHLAGCTFDEVPVIRLNADADGPNAYRIFGPADDLGRKLDDRVFAELGLQRLVPAARPPTVSPREERRLIGRALQAAAAMGGGQPASEPDQIVWCKYARGKIQFTIGELVANVSFGGWARTIEPPAYRCPASGEETFAVAATSDDRIVAAAQIAVCQQTGRRLPRCELVHCAVTDQLVSRELAAPCPVSGQMVLEQRLVPCPVCRELVSPLAIQRGRCAGCGRLSAVSREDPRMRQILKQHPRLSSWQWLRLAETETSFLVIAAGFFQRRLLVLDKETLTVRHAARGSRVSRTWKEVSSTEDVGFW